SCMSVSVSVTRWYGPLPHITLCRCFRASNAISLPPRTHGPSVRSTEASSTLARGVHSGSARRIPMTFAELSTYLDRMEGTRSRNELVKTLAELYTRTSPDEIQPATYLIQGRLAPFFEPVEIGMGEKLVMAAIGQAAGFPIQEVTQRFNSLGDLGLV